MYKYITSSLDEDSNVRHAGKKTKLNMKEDVSKVDTSIEALLIPLIIEIDGEYKYSYEKALVETSITQILLSYTPIRHLLKEEIRNLTDYLVYSLKVLTESESWKNGLFSDEDKETSATLSLKFWNKEKIDYKFEFEDRLSFIPVPLYVENEEIFVIPPRVNYHRILYALLQPKSETESQMLSFECAVRSLSEVLTNFKVRQNNWEDFTSGKTDDFIFIDLIQILRSFGRATVYWINSYSWRSGEIMSIDKYEISRKIPYKIEIDSF